MSKGKLFNRFITRLLTFLGFGTTAFAFMACYAPPTEAYHVVVSPTNISLPAEATETDINVESNGGWAVTVENPFVTVTPTSGWGDATLTIKASDNPTDKSRTSHITVTVNDEASSTVSISQQGAALSWQ